MSAKRQKKLRSASWKRRPALPWLLRRSSTRSGPYYSLPSETNKYTHVFLAQPVVRVGAPVLDTEIEKYFDMSVVELPLATAFDSIGDTIRGMETAGALMLARASISAR